MNEAVSKSGVRVSDGNRFRLRSVLYFRDGMRWAHLSCALWIPEIVIADTEKMEPITNISDIPVCCFVPLFTRTVVW